MLQIQTTSHSKGWEQISCVSSHSFSNTLPFFYSLPSVVFFILLPRFSILDYVVQMRFSWKSGSLCTCIFGINNTKKTKQSGRLCWLAMVYRGFTCCCFLNLDRVSLTHPLLVCCRSIQMRNVMKCGCISLSVCDERQKVIRNMQRNTRAVQKSWDKKKRLLGRLVSKCVVCVLVILPVFLVQIKNIFLDYNFF